MDKGNTISTRQKLGALVKRFIKYMDQQKNNIFQINQLVNEGARIFKDQKKPLDIIFYFQALGLILRISVDHMIYVGFRGMVRKLMEFENQQNQEVQYEDANIMGKSTYLRPQLLCGQLLAKIFYSLIYQKDMVSKSSIQDIVEAFMHQQKDLNLKNFIPDILNILSIIGLIEKNQGTQIITYIGPDLKCYDQNNKKVSWKMLELIKREEQIFGKEEEIQQKFEKEGQVGLAPVHMSYFPELSYAVLRSNTWEKTISSTVFFIGRNEKRTNLNQKVRTCRVDFQLPYRSVSRQHAIILYNFETQRWQIRCLSKKNMIKVDGQRFAYGDKNVWLRNKGEIQIGPQKMVFLQASSNLE